MREVTDRRGWTLGALALLLGLLALAAAPTVAAANVAPQCQTGINGQVLRTGKPSTVQVFCSDPDAQPLTIQATTPDHGTLSAFAYNGDNDAYEATFTPAGSYIGPDDFAFVATDGSAFSSSYGFDLVITENHAPRCEPTGAVHTKVGEPVEAHVFCSDGDIQDQNLTYTPVAGQGPDHGSVAAVDDQTVVYTPTGGYSGRDHFTIRASDGQLADTYSQVVHVADTPLCETPAPVQVRSGKGRFLAVDCTRPADDAGVEKYEVGTLPTKGTVSPTGLVALPERFYEADSGATGADSYTIRMVSSSGSSPYVTQAITTGPNVNHAPVCDEAAFTREAVFTERRFELPITCTDLDDDPIDYAAATAPDHGTSDTDDGRVFYTGDVDWQGFDEVPFTASDGHGGTTAATFPVNVRPPEEPECFQGPIALSVRPGKSVRVELFCVNPQGDAQGYSATPPPSKGTLGSFDADGGVTYTANAGASGTDTFSIRATNDVGESEPQSVTITIDANFNRAPQCNENPGTPKRIGKNATASLDFAGVCQDPDGDPLQFVRQTSPGHGTLSAGPASTLSYTPTTDYLGPDSFTYSARDDRGLNSTAVTFSLTVVESTAPTCDDPAPITVRTNQARSIGLSCTDQDGQTITYRIVTPPRGTLSPPGDSTTATRTYTAPASAGPDSFSFKAVTSGGESVVRTQQITVDTDFNSAPVCTSNSGFPDDVVQNRATQLPIATWCEDPDGDTLTLTRTTPDPQHGTATASNGAITYTSAAGYTGTDSFGYTAGDGHGGTVTETYSVNVVLPVPPTCEDPEPVDARPGGRRTLALSCFDDNGDALDFQITDPPDLGTLDPAGDGPTQVRTYHAGPAEGRDEFSYRAGNLNGTASAVTQELVLDPDANVAPECVTNSGFPEHVTGGQASTLEPLCSDDDGDDLGYTKLSEPVHGTLSDAGGELVYTPTNGYAGPDEFVIKAFDGHGGESSQITHHVAVSTPPAPTCEPSTAITLRPNTSRPVVFDCAGDDLGYVIDSPPARGSLTGSGAARTYTAGGDEGDASFTWHAHSDAAGNSALQTQTITVDADHNVAPACPSSITVAANAGEQQTVTPACTDADGDALGFVKLSDPAHGALTDAGGVLEYTATLGYDGTDSFTYRATDGHGGQSGSGTVTVNVTDTNRAPACTGSPSAFEVEQDDVLDLPAPSCTDEDGDTLTYAVVTPPAHGTLGAPAADGARTYTPDAGYAGDDSFTFRASDGVAQSGLQTVNITVTPPPNDPPACADVSRNIAPGAPATIQLACTDPDGDPVTLEIVTAPAHGTLGAIDQGTDRVVYTPDAGYTGGDSFSYRATDGTVAGPQATVSIDVTGAPECEDVARKTEVGTAVAIPLSCTDPDGDALTLSTVAAPSHGTLGSIDQGTDQVLYTPNAGYHGSDSFTYRASDGTASSAAATVSITVTRAPNCTDAARRTAVGAPVSVPLSCADADGDTLTLSITGAPAHGSLGAIAGGAVTYTPQAGYFGTDTFTFKASDGTASSAAATASITVTRAPSCSDVSRTTAAGVAVTVPVSCTDPDGDALTLSKVSDPAKGTLGSFSGSVTYTPTAGQHGADSFTYRASDGTASSAAATVSITITRAPTCSPVSAKTAVGTAVAVALDCTDADGDPLSLEIVSGPSKGSLGAISGGSVTYTPAAGQFGTDTFTFRASDGTAQSGTATATITITRPPSCQTVNVRTKVGTAVQVPLSCSDPDGDVLTLSTVGAPSKGTLGPVSGGTVLYTPDAGQFGADSFTYRASDGTANSAAATVNVTITRAPACQDVGESVTVGSSVAVPLTCSDADGDSLTLAIADGPDRGSLGAISAGSVTYTPHADATGEDTFTFTASDGTVVSAPATVTITLTGPPHCEDVSRRTRVGTAVSVPLTCTDPEGDPLTPAIADGPDKGSLGAIAGGSVTYTPNGGEFGTDQFTYRANDGTGDSAAATATIRISRAPSCEDVSRRTVVDTSVSVPLTCTDPDDGDTLTLAEASDPDHGALGSFSATAVTYTPDAGAFGEDSFTYTADDGAGPSAAATVSITITRAPTCSPVATDTPAETPVTVTLSCADPDGDSLTLHKASGAAHGTLGDIAGGEVTYTPDDGFSGEDSFTYRAEDGTASSGPATVTVTVLPPPNQAPECEPVDATTAAGEAVAVTLDCSDPDGDDLALSVVDAPAHGTLGAVSGGEVTYTPADGSFGPDSFTYRASDGDLQSSPATATLDVQMPPEVSLASDRPIAQEGSDLTFTATASDEDGTIEEYRFRADGVVVQTGDAETLTRRFTGAGTHTVEVRVTDDDGRTATATKSVTISPDDDPGDPGDPGTPGTPGTPGGGGGGATPPAGGGGADVAAPAATLKAAKQKLKAVLAKGLALTASCSEPCTLKLQLVVDKKTAKKLKLGKKPTVIGKLTRSVSGTAKLKVKLTGKAKKRLKRAKSVKLTVKAIASDVAGNATTKTAKVTLKR